MMYLGFDLGDGESCVHWTKDGSAGMVNVIPVSGHGSFLTAIGKLAGNTIVGHTVKENEESAEDVHVCFKRRFLEHDPETDRIIQDFARGVLAELRKNPDVGTAVDDSENTRFIVGCPAGWKEADRERYRLLLTEAGMKNVKIVSESRAAFENALHSTENAIDPDLAGQTMLIIDIGSSTLDFAYVKDGNEYAVSTMGNVLLGGGLMDEMIVLRSLELQEQTAPGQVREIRELIGSSDAKKSRLMLAVREMKENYFRNEDLFLEKNSSLEKTVKLFGNGRVYQVKLTLSPEIVENWLISRPHPLLSGQSFETRLRDSLVSVYEQTKKQQVPGLVILTGGASRMHFFQELCRSQFPSSRIIISDNPEYDISRGLVFVGSVDENMTACLQDIRSYVESDAVEEIIGSAVPELVRSISRPMTDSILTGCVKPSFQAWRNGELDTLDDFEADTERRVKQFMRSGSMQAAVREQVEPWSEQVIRTVEMDICEISRKHHVDFTIDHGTLSIQSDGGNQNPLKINFIDMIQAVVSVVLIVVMSMICGGTGTALLAAGPLGIVLGALLAVLAIALGKNRAAKLLMSMKIPAVIRRMISVDSILSQENRLKISADLCRGMMEDMNMVRNLVDQVSECVDSAIADAAGDVEQAMVA